MLLNIDLSESNNTPQNTNSLLNKKRKAHKAPDSTNGNKKKHRKRGKEFYTLYEDIDEQMKAAQDAYDFKDKTVLCNCDNPLESNFFSYFVKNFHKLGLQKLICTCYKKNGKGLKIEIDNDNFETIFGEDFKTKKEEEQDDIIANFREQENSKLCYIKEMEGDGNCLGKESLKNLAKSDIVVTNPPFGKIASKLIRQIVDNNKKFILICELHDILGVRNNKLYNKSEYNIDFGKNSYEMCFMTPDNEKSRVHCAKWINNIGIDKNAFKESSNYRQDDDRVRQMLDIDNVYAIPHTNLQKTLNFIDEVYKNHGNDTTLSVTPSLFYDQNSIFNKKNFNIIGLCDESNEIKTGKKQPRIRFARLERKDDSPDRKATKHKKQCKDLQGKPYYQYDVSHVLCKKKDCVDLDKINKIKFVTTIKDKSS